MQNKKDLRKIMLAKRRDMPPEEAAAKSRLICQRLGELLRERLAAPCPLVLSYLAYGREASLEGLHRELWRLGWGLAAPRTAGLEPGIMEAAAYTPETELVKCGLGVLEPAGAKIYLPEELDAVILPGVAFDESCGRLGHGAGYYDRLLPGLKPGALLVGAAYEWQVLPAGQVPRESWDQPCGFVVTEQRVIGGY